MFIDANLMQETLRRVLRRGGEYADIFYESRDAVNITLDDDRIEQSQGGHIKGVGIRLIYNFKTAYAFCNPDNPRDLFDVAEQLTNIASSSECSRVIDFRTNNSPPINNIKRHPLGVSLEDKTKLLLQGNRIARSMGSAIKQARAAYSDLTQSIMIATSEGKILSEERVYTTAMLHAVAIDGAEIQTGYEAIGGMIGFEIFDNASFEQACESASKRALLMLKAKRMKGGRMPVVISSSAGGTMIHEAVGHGLEADLAMQGLSVYSGRLQEKIASDIITVIDDGTMAGKRGSFNCDDEGNPASKTVLIEKGILKAYMSDRYNSLKYNIPITGNGRRASYENKPIPRMTNTFIAPGEDIPEEIIRSTDRGLFVKKMGGGQVNTVTGDFVFEVQEGYLIDKGSIGHPVRGVTLIGNCQRTLQSIDRVGNDLGFSIGTCGKDGQGVPVSDAMPTVRIPEMVVGGMES